MTAGHLLYRLSRCLYSEPKVWENSLGKWITVSVPADLWQAIMDKSAQYGREQAQAGKKEV